MRQWLRLGLDQIAWRHELKLLNKGSHTRITQTSVGSCAGGTLRIHSEYTPGAVGIRVLHSFRIPRAFTDLPRIGIRWQLPGSFEHLSWLGNGPHETYRDRKTSALYAVHASTVHDQYLPYILPQEHGNLTEVTWLSLHDQTLALTVRANPRIEASASHYPHEILTPAFHTYEVSPDASTWLSLDVMQRGLGGASCGPDTLPEYRIGPGRYQLCYQMNPETLK